MSRKPQFYALFVAALVSVAACDLGGDRVPERADAETQGWLDAPTQLAPIDHSGVTGSVVPDRVGDELTITVALEGLAPGSSYSAYLHDDRCAAAGLVRLPLGRIRAREDGTATVRLRAPIEDLPAGETVSVHVRTEGGVPVACANLLPDG